MEAQCPRCLDTWTKNARDAKLPLPMLSVELPGTHVKLVPLRPYDPTFPIPEIRPSNLYGSPVWWQLATTLFSRGALILTAASTLVVLLSTPIQSDTVYSIGMLGLIISMLFGLAAILCHGVYMYATAELRRFHATPAVSQISMKNQNRQLVWQLKLFYCHRCRGAFRSDCCKIVPTESVEELLDIPLEEVTDQAA